MKLVEAWKRWLVQRGERRCAHGAHAWKHTDWPTHRFGTGMAFLVGMAVAGYYSWAECRRCGVVGRAVK